ncbi:MAG: hypothetical protein WCT45_01120 [Candidatus Paceibacterota bacterium]|jgi:hypothetical protein
MPKNRNNPPRRAARSKPPETMTWGKAAPVLVVAGIFDLIRIFFEMLWFFGPALVGLYCADKVGDVAVVGKALIAACTYGATTVGVVGAPAIEAFGVIMAIAVGFFGWLFIGFLLVIKNPRIFQKNAGNIAWFAGGLLVSEVPFVGVLPALTGTLLRLYAVQIKQEGAALKQYEKEQVAHELAERKRQAAELLQMQQRQQLAANEEAASNVIPFPSQEAAPDEEEIPDEIRKAA